MKPHLAQCRNRIDYLLGIVGIGGFRDLQQKLLGSEAVLFCDISVKDLAQLRIKDIDS